MTQHTHKQTLALGPEHEAAKRLIGYTTWPSVSALYRHMIREGLLAACAERAISGQLTALREAYDQHAREHIEESARIDANPKHPGRVWRPDEDTEEIAGEGEA